MLGAREVLGPGSCESVVTELCRAVESTQGVLADGPAAALLDAYEALGGDAPRENFDGSSEQPQPDASTRALLDTKDWSAAAAHLASYPAQAVHFARPALDAVHTGGACLDPIISTLALVFRHCAPQQVWSSELRYTPLATVSAVLDSADIDAVDVTRLFVWSASLLESLADDTGAYDGAIKLLANYLFERAQMQHVAERRRDACLVAGCVLVELRLLDAFDTLAEQGGAAECIVGDAGVTRVLELYAVQIAAAVRFPRLVRTVGVALCYDAVRLGNSHLVLGDAASEASQLRKTLTQEQEDVYYDTLRAAYTPRLSPPGCAPALWKEVGLLFGRDDGFEVPTLLGAYVARAASLLACLYPAPVVQTLLPRRLASGTPPPSQAAVEQQIVGCVVATRRGMAAVSETYASVGSRVGDPVRALTEPLAALVSSAEPAIVGTTEATMRSSLDIAYSRFDMLQSCFMDHGEEALQGVCAFLSAFALAATSVPTAAPLARNTIMVLDSTLQVLCDKDIGLLLPHIPWDAAAPNEPLWTSLATLWELVCSAIMHIFRGVPQWSRTADRSEMLAWLDSVPRVASFAVRNAGMFAEALSSEQAPPEACARITELLALPVDGAIDWIRLNNAELVQQLYDYLRRTVAEFSRREIAMPEQVVMHALNFVRAQLAVKDASQRKTLLSTTQLEVLEEEFVAVRRAAPKPRASKKHRLLQARLPFAPVAGAIDVDAIPDTPKRGIRPADPVRSASGFGQTRPRAPPKTPGPTSKLTQLRSEFQQSRSLARRPIAPRRELEPGEPAAPLARSSLPLNARAAPPRVVRPREESSSSSSSDESESGIQALQSPRKRRVPALRYEKRQRVRMMGDDATQKMLARAEEARRRQRLCQEPDYAPLHRCILGWTLEMEALPVFLDEQPAGELTRVPPKFDSASEYAAVFGPQFLHECWAQFQQAKEEYGGASVPLSFVSRRMIDTFDEFVFSFAGERLTRETTLYETDVVVLEHGLTRILAKVQGVKRMAGSCVATLRCFLSTRKHLADRLSSEGGWRLGKLFSLTTLLREYAALASIGDIDLRADVLSARVSPKLLVSGPDVAQARRRFGLNEPQATAIVAAQRTPGFSLIQGPPGTGKTKTIRALVTSLVARRGTRMDGSSKGPRILLCAPSNAAVDELVVRVREGIELDGRLVRPRVVRIGREDAVSPEARDSTLDAEIRRRKESGPKSDSPAAAKAALEEHRAAWAAKKAAIERTRNDPAAARRLQRELDEMSDVAMDLEARVRQASSGTDQAELRDKSLKARIIEEAEVICTTLGGAGRTLLYGLEFDMIVVDEAAQAVELSTLIPLRYASPRCVLVGDPQQLPPTVISQTAEAAGYSQSLFVRMFNQNHDRVHLLSIQYRMHPDISVFPSSAFYGSQLADGAGMAAATAQPWHEYDAFGPFRFFDLPDAHESASASHSVSNRGEADAAVELYAALQVANKASLAGRVGFVSMYKPQVQLLRRIFVQRFGGDAADDATFNTVDGFQGQEKDVIILSCVRSNPQNVIGFLKDTRRLNVALTRAKSSLFVLGNAGMLARASPTWEHLVDTAKAMHSLTRFSSSALRALRRATPEMLAARRDAKRTLPQKRTAPIGDREPKRHASGAAAPKHVVTPAAQPARPVARPGRPVAQPGPVAQPEQPSAQPAAKAAPESRAQTRPATPIARPAPTGKWAQKLEAARQRASDPSRPARPTPIATPRAPVPIRPPAPVRPPVPTPSWLRSSRPSGVRPKK